MTNVYQRGRWKKFLVILLLIYASVMSTGYFVSRFLLPSSVDSEPKSSANLRPYIVSEEAQTFVTSFAKEYFTWSSDTPNEELKKYIADGIEPQAGLKPGKVSKSMAYNAQIYKITQKTDTRATIIVKVESSLEKDSKQYKVTRYLAVPIATDNISFAVVDYPYLVSGPISKAKLKKDEIVDGTKVEGDASKGVRQFLEEFFRSYSTENEQKLSYLMVGGQRVKGYGGLAEFVEFDSIQIYEAEKEGYRVEVLARFKDRSMELSFVSPYKVVVVQEGNQWKVKSIEGK